MTHGHRPERQRFQRFLLISRWRWRSVSRRANRYRLRFSHAVIFSWEYLLVLPVTWNFVVNQIIPLVLAWSFERKLAPKIAQEASTIELSPDHEWLMALSVKDLEDAHKIEMQRRDDFRKQAQNNLIAITLSITFVFGTLQLTSRAPDPNNLHTMFALLVKLIILGAVMSFFMSASASMKIVGPTRVYDMWLQTRGHSYRRSSPEADTRAKYVKIIILNQANNLILANYSRTSYVGLRNGLYGIGIVLIISVLRDGRIW